MATVCGPGRSAGRGPKDVIGGMCEILLTGESEMKTIEEVYQTVLREQEQAQIYLSNLYSGAPLGLEFPEHEKARMIGMTQAFELILQYIKFIEKD
jgi:hypothetical protein